MKNDIKPFKLTCIMCIFVNCKYDFDCHFDTWDWMSFASENEKEMFFSFSFTFGKNINVEKTRIFCSYTLKSD